MESEQNKPEFYWAQRKDRVLLTFSTFHSQAIVTNIVLNSMELSFLSTSQADQTTVSRKINFYSEIEVQESKILQDPKHSVRFLLIKKEKNSQYWPRVTSDDADNWNFKIDGVSDCPEDLHDGPFYKMGMGCWIPEEFYSYDGVPENKYLKTTERTVLEDDEDC